MPEVTELPRLGAAAEAFERQADQEWRGLVFGWMGLALVFHLIAAWCSVGHHSVDEYFQILEFLSYKRGLTPPGDLAGEFSERMRPWMQPFLYGLLVKAWVFCGVRNPFTWAWSFRLVTGLLGWLSGVGLALRAREWFEDPRARRFCVRAIALLWFLPALHVRPSSESLGGTAFLLGLVLLTGRLTGARLWLGGALLGLSFEARFQMGFMVLGLGLWLAVIARPGWRALAQAAAGLAIVFVLGRWIDRWGYGEWVLSPWRYVQFNLLRGEVNRYGQAPIWDVFRMSFTESWPFLGLALAAASLVAWVRHPRHPLTWAQAPFFVIHEAIAHKELRFFFPIALAGPVLLTQALCASSRDRLPSVATGFFDPSRSGWPLRLLWRFLLVNNAVALAALLLLPFSRPVQFYEKVWDLIPPAETRFELLFRGTDPYHLLGNPVYFYRPPALQTREFHEYAELGPRLAAGETLHVFEPSLTLPPEAARLAAHCAPEIRTLPEWVSKLNFNGWLERAHPWTLFRCR